MSLYDEGNPFLRSRPFWEEEEEEAVAVQPKVTPVAVPEPEDLGPGYATPEEAAGLPAPAVVPEGPGFATPEEAAAGVEFPNPEAPGFATPEEAAGLKPPSIGDLAYRTLVEPITKPVETLREGLGAAFGQKSRPLEFVDRIRRNWDTAMEETKAAFQHKAGRLLSAEQNPYIATTTAEAKAAVPQLEQEIAEEEKKFAAAGGDPSLVGQEWAIEPAPEIRAQSQRIGDLRRQLGQAKEAATGAPKEAFAGTLSRSFEDTAEASRDRKKEIIKEYEPLIDKSRDKELWMATADSLGATGPSLAGSVINPLFGLSLMYAQSFESARSEFLEKGGDPAKADEYADTQALASVPMEILGELPLAGIGRGVLMRLVKDADPAKWAKWITERATEVTQNLASEVGIVTPFQTVAEQKIGEEFGVKPKMTDAELAANILQAQKVAAMQVGVAGGGPIAVEAATRLADTTGITPVVNPAAAPVAPSTAVPPPFPPTPDAAFAPPGTVVEAPGTPPGAVPGAVTMGPPAAPPTVTPPAIEPGPSTPAGAVVTQVTGAHNIAVKEIADEQSQNLQASNAPKTAQAIQQLAGESSADATITAAEFLEQAKVQNAEAQAKAVAQAAKAAPAPEAAAAPAPAPTPAEIAAAPQPRAFGVPPPLPTAPEAFAPPAATPAAPQAAPAEPQQAVVVGGQVFTGATRADAIRAAHKAVGVDALGSAESGWVDPETGRFVSHDIFNAHQALNTAIEESGGDMESPAVTEAGAALAEAQQRDVEVNNQIIQPGGEQVVNPGIKGQEVLVSTRPSQELAVPLAGVVAEVRGVDAQGRTAVEHQPAAKALNDARNDRTALTILLDCLH